MVFLGERVRTDGGNWSRKERVPLSFSERQIIVFGKLINFDSQKLAGDHISKRAVGGSQRRGVPS